MVNSQLRHRCSYAGVSVRRDQLHTPTGQVPCFIGSALRKAACREKGDKSNFCTSGVVISGDYSRRN